MTVSQNLENLNNPEQQNQYIDHVTVTDVPQGNFLAETADEAPADGGDTRTITIQLMPLEQATGGTKTLQTGMYVRQSGETQVTVNVMDTDGTTQLATNTTSY